MEGILDALIALIARAKAIQNEGIDTRRFRVVIEGAHRREMISAKAIKITIDRICGAIGSAREERSKDRPRNMKYAMRTETDRTNSKPP
jgi:hypothetical protein